MVLVGFAQALVRGPNEDVASSGPFTSLPPSPARSPWAAPLGAPGEPGSVLPRTHRPASLAAHPASALWQGSLGEEHWKIRSVLCPFGLGWWPFRRVDLNSRLSLGDSWPAHPGEFVRRACLPVSPLHRGRHRVDHGNYFLGSAGAATAGPLGHTVISLPSRHCITKALARMFWPLSSNFTPQPVAVLPNGMSKAMAAL